MSRRHPPAPSSVLSEIDFDNISTTDFNIVKEMLGQEMGELLQQNVDIDRKRQRAGLGPRLGGGGGGPQIEEVKEPQTPPAMSGRIDMQRALEYNVDQQPAPAAASSSRSRRPPRRNLNPPPRHHEEPQVEEVIDLGSVDDADLLGIGGGAASLGGDLASLPPPEIGDLGLDGASGDLAEMEVAGDDEDAIRASDQDLLSGLGGGSDDLLLGDGGGGGDGGVDDFLLGGTAEELPPPEAPAPAEDTSHRRRRPARRRASATPMAAAAPGSQGRPFFRERLEAYRATANQFGEQESTIPPDLVPPPAVRIGPAQRHVLNQTEFRPDAYSQEVDVQQENQNLETRQAKQEVLMYLLEHFEEETKENGWNLQLPLYELEYLKKRRTQMVHKSNKMRMMRKWVRYLAYSVVGINHCCGSIIRLEGPTPDDDNWADVLTEDMTEFEPVLEYFYNRYFRHGETNPVMQICLTIFGTMLVFHYQGARGMRGGGGGDDYRDRRSGRGRGGGRGQGRRGAEAGDFFDNETELGAPDVDSDDDEVDELLARRRPAMFDTEGSSSRRGGKRGRGRRSGGGGGGGMGNGLSMLMNVFGGMMNQR